MRSALMTVIGVLALAGCTFIYIEGTNNHVEDTGGHEVTTVPLAPPAPADKAPLPPLFRKPPPPPVPLHP